MAQSISVGVAPSSVRVFSQNAAIETKAESGLAILEFALVAVFILIIGTAGLEFAQSLRILESATTLSREIASSSYRNCAGGVASEHDGYPFEFYSECLRDAISNIRAGMATVLPGSSVVVTLYEYAPPPGDPDVSRFMRRGSFADGTEPSRFTTSDSGEEISGNVDSKELESHRWIVIAEIFVPYGLKSSVLHIFRPSHFYDATIM